ncbi:MAG: Holliday junction branch migration protein RuvA [Parcubacteria group bacterium]|nr:Holliday junction branch migration protein RuvA [Parcubacteria group bacterium]
MIGKIEGKIVHKDLRFVIVDVSGVGYKVYGTHSITGKTGSGEKISLWTYLAVRENALDLYGFTTKEELDFFELLISVSGIGPKSALGILNIATIKTLRQAVSSGDTSHLTKVSGIGKKNAEKIVLELKDKLEGLESEDGVGNSHMKNEVDAIEALKSLGYSQIEAREALKKVSKDIIATGEKVKQALKILGTNN